MAEVRTMDQVTQIPRLAVVGLALGLALAGCWALVGGIRELMAGSAYLTALNQAYLVLLWALIIRLGAALYTPCDPSGLSPLVWSSAAWALGLGAALLIWAGLSARQVMAGDWQSLLSLSIPVLATMGVGLLGLWIMSGLLKVREPVIPAVIFCLVGLGLALLTRVGVELTAEGRREVLAHLAWRQAAWFAMGLMAMAFTAGLASKRRLARLARKKYLLPVVAALLLVVTWLLGPEINGRRLWLTFGQMSLQTVEVVKFLMVVFAAAYFTYEHPQVMTNLPRTSMRGVLSMAGPYALMHGLPLLALAVQRDFGPAVLLYGFFLVMLYLASGNRWLTATGFIALLAVGVAGYLYQLPAMLHFRVRAWLEPFEASEHLTRGLWSIADGGLWGTGWGVGRPHTVPLSYSDFAFASLAEELGLLGGCAVLALFLLFAWRGMVLAVRAADPQDRLMAAGATVMITLQALLVLGGVTGLIPLAGLTLPFVSYGGSSLVVNMAMAGLLMRIAKNGAES